MYYFHQFTHCTIVKYLANFTHSNNETSDYIFIDINTKELMLKNWNWSSEKIFVDKNIYIYIYIYINISMLANRFFELCKFSTKLDIWKSIIYDKWHLIFNVDVCSLFMTFRLASPITYYFAVRLDLSRFTKKKNRNKINKFIHARTHTHRNTHTHTHTHAHTYITRGREREREREIHIFLRGRISCIFY